MLHPSAITAKMVKTTVTAATKQKRMLIAGETWLLSFCFLIASLLVLVAVANFNDVWRLPTLKYSRLLSNSEAPRDVSRPFPRNQSFTLRHIYHRGATLFPELHRRFDLSVAEVESARVQDIDLRDDGIGSFMIGSSTTNIWRFRDSSFDAGEPIMYRGLARGLDPNSAWILDDMSSPNITDKGTIANLAFMAANAYSLDSKDPDWKDVNKPFNQSSDLGWENDGLRGHVFADETNSTIVISIKGTSSAVFDGAETTRNDKINDNLFAGCCGGQGRLLTRKACNCMTSTYTCNEDCIFEEMHKPSRYYQASIDLYGNITEQYPNADVWLIGHSLGGLVTSLLGLTFGVPVVTFESIPHALAASRLGILPPPDYHSLSETEQHGGLWNFGHTADPVYMGLCNGVTSLCTMAGYALESQCHAGLRCVYDVVKDYGWSVSLATHGIKESIRDVYQVYDQVPACEFDGDCVDCFEWKKDYSNITKTSTVSSSTSPSSSSRTHTRTETCKTPGWWGCRDEPETSPTITRVSTKTLTITSCNSYGWFGGCLDSSTITTTSTTTVTAATPTMNIISSYIAHTTSFRTRGYLYEDRDNSTSSSLHLMTAHHGL